MISQAGFAAIDDQCTATFDAEYVALTQLQADALITLDRQLADAVKDLVTVAPIEALF